MTSFSHLHQTQKDGGRVFSGVGIQGIDVAKVSETITLIFEDGRKGAFSDLHLSANI